MENRIIHLDIVSLEDKNLKSLLNRYLKEENLTAMYGQHSYSLAGLNYILSISDIKPEIAFVDVDGLADEQTITVRELKQHHPHVILVGVSNKSASDIISAGYDAYLQPLFTNSQLTDLISVSKIKVNELPSINSTDYDYDPDSNTLIKPVKSDFNFSNLDEDDNTETDNSNSEFNSDEDEPVSDSNNDNTTSESKSDAENKEQNKQHQTRQSEFNNRNKNKHENKHEQHKSDIKSDRNDNHVKSDNNHSSEIKSDEEHEQQHADKHVTEIKSEQKQSRRERYKKNRHNFKQNKVKYAETGSKFNNSNDNYKQSKKQDKWEQFKQKKIAEQKEREKKQASEIKSDEAKKSAKLDRQKTELDLDASIDDMLSQENSDSDFKISVPGYDTKDAASGDSASESNNSNKDEKHDNHDDNIPADLKSDDKNKKPEPDDMVNAPADDGDKPMPDLGGGDDGGVQDNSDNKASGKWINSSNVTSDDAGTSGGLNIDFSDDDDLIAGLKNSMSGNDDTVPADNGSDDQDQNTKYMDE